MRGSRELLFLLSIVVSEVVHSAACCGGGANFPSLILSDDRAQIGLSAGSSIVIGDTNAVGRSVFRSSDDDEWINTLTLDGAVLIADRWQIGGSIPLAQRSRSTADALATDWGLADNSLTLGYEAIPEFTYSRWKPRGFLYFQLTFPTGGNIYSATKPFAVDARGRGFYTLSLGTFLIKTWGAWDTSFRIAINRSLNRNFAAADGSTIAIHPGFDLGAAIATGYSPQQSDWRFGITLNPAYTAKTNVGRSKLVWTSSLEANRLVAQQWALGLVFNDQTLIGPAKNTSLERGIAVSCRYKWPR